jgi:MFS transporter, FSR family, fosmidomycin resistance protein
VREAAWPLIRSDLGLSYAAIGLLIAVPNLAGSLIEPLFGILGDAGHRRRVIVSGGAVFALALAIAWTANGFTALLVAFAILGPASGAFVSLSQASFMDIDPAARERNMARWVLAGSVGVVVGPLLLAGAVAIGLGWREAFLGCAIGTIPLVLLVARVRDGRASAASVAESFRTALGAFRRREVLRWLGVLELTDLLGDVLLGFVALYFVDVAGATPATAGLAVAVLGVAGLAGDGLLLLILRRMRGDTWLRLGAVAMLVAYPAFLLAPSIPAKLALLVALAVLRAGWYALPKARLFDHLDSASGAAIAVSDVSGLVGSLLPLGLGALAQRLGLGVAMWFLLAAPLALLLLLPRATPSVAEAESGPQPDVRD